MLFTNSFFRIAYSGSVSLYFFFFLMIRPPPRSTLFPYTRSSDLEIEQLVSAKTIPSSTVREKIAGDSPAMQRVWRLVERDRKSTRLNSSHEWISYAVFCLKKKTKKRQIVKIACERSKRRAREAQR